MGLTSPFWGVQKGSLPVPAGPCLGSEVKPKAPETPALVPAPLGKPGVGFTSEGIFTSKSGCEVRKWRTSLLLSEKQGYPLVISLDLLAHLVRIFTYRTADFHGLSISQITTGIYKGSTGYL